MGRASLRRIAVRAAWELYRLEWTAAILGFVVANLGLLSEVYRILSIPPGPLSLLVLTVDLGGMSWLAWSALKFPAGIRPDAPPARSAVRPTGTPAGVP